MITPTNSNLESSQSAWASDGQEDIEMIQAVEDDSLQNQHATPAADFNHRASYDYKKF